MKVLARSVTAAQRGLQSRRLRSLLAGTAATVAAACACLLAATQPSTAASAVIYQQITGAGSTWAGPAINQWDSDVSSNYGLQVNYEPVGSTTGRKNFKDGTVQFGASEIPYGQYDGTVYDTPPTQGYAYMPDVAGGTVFMYNLTIGTKRVTNLRLSGQSVANIFTGVDTYWDATDIKHDNPQINLPHLAIVPVVRSDGSGSTADLTDWMLKTQGPIYQKYCQETGRNPCTQTSTYPLWSGDPAMTAQNGDPNVAGYVSAPQANGAIGYVEYSYAISSGFPVAKLENSAGYYTEPTPGHIAVSLLAAKINSDKTSVNYLTEDLSGVYTNPDARTYELSAYSYFILPTDTTKNITTAQGKSLGAYGSYLLCQGQNQVDNLGYSALPINLVEAGYSQLSKIPGAVIPNTSGGFIQTCNNPTFDPNGNNKLAETDPQPPACDKAGGTQCNTATGGAPGSNPVTGGGSNPGGNGGTSPGGTNPGSTNPGSTNPGSTNPGSTNPGSTNPSSGASTPAGSSGSGTPGAGTVSGAAAQSTCDPNTGVCTPASGSSGTNGSVATGANGVPVPIALSASNGNGVQVMLMSLAAALFLGLCVIPPLVASASDSRRQRRRGNWPGGPGGNGGPGAWR